MRECPVTGIPPIVVETIGVAVPLPIVGVPVDVDDKHNRYVTIPIQTTGIREQAHEHLYFMRDLEVLQILSPTTIVSFLDLYTLRLAKP